MAGAALQFTATVSKLTLDAKALRVATDRASRRNLMREGAFIRRAARSSIRKRKRVSRPGEPPSSHAGDLKKLIVFSYENGTVVVGPRLHNQVSFTRDMKPVRGTIPQALEEGGDLTVVEEKTPWGWRRRSHRSRTRAGNRPIRKRRIHVAARPYMGPAEQSARRDLDKFWKDSIR